MAYELGKKYYVVCRSMSEFITYRNTKIKQLDRNNQQYRILDFVFVDTPIKLRGCRDIHGVFYGNWKQNPEIKEILETIHMNNFGGQLGPYELPESILEFYNKELKRD